jgi:hypothetical protein
MIKKLLLILLLGFSTSLLHAKLPINQVIVWGHKDSHTHGYIHRAFDRTFRAMGYHTLWLDRHDNISEIDFSNTLFITEGQVDQNIPIRLDCWYIIHNCDPTKYQPVINANRCITLQVYTHDVLERAVEKISPCIYRSVPDKILYMPWATDLLPDEIDEIKKQLPAKRKRQSQELHTPSFLIDKITSDINRSLYDEIVSLHKQLHILSNEIDFIKNHLSLTEKKSIYWIGTIGGGFHGNNNEINGFKRACAENGIQFEHKHGVSLEDNIAMIQKSYIAPTIVGAWQVRQGYVPCRIFKNISYGQMGVTNSKTVYDLFEGKIVYNPDTYKLFFDAQEKIDSMSQNELFELMDFVRDNHTYVNRIEVLLELLEDVWSQ